MRAGPPRSGVAAGHGRTLHEHAFVAIVRSRPPWWRLSRRRQERGRRERARALLARAARAHARRQMRDDISILCAARLVDVASEVLRG